MNLASTVQKSIYSSWPSLWSWSYSDAQFRPLGVQGSSTAWCSACGRSPCRLNSNYCGSACERHAAQYRQQRQHQRDSTSTRSTQEQAPPSGSDDWTGDLLEMSEMSVSVGDPTKLRPLVTCYVLFQDDVCGDFGSRPLPRTCPIGLRLPYYRLTVDSSFLVPGNVRCPRCGHIYRAPGRSVNRPDMLSDNPTGLSSLPPCPSCGFYPQL